LNGFEEIEISKGAALGLVEDAPTNMGKSSRFALRSGGDLTEYAVAKRWSSTAHSPYNLELCVGTHHCQTAQADHIGRHCRPS
jgi:hypothetical protein